MTRRARLLAGVAGLAAGFAAAPAADPPAATPSAATVQDVVYFAKTGPVRVRFRVGFAGASAEAAWQAAVDRLFAFCDRDGNGTLDAKERAVFTRPGRQPAPPVDADDDGPAAAAQVFGPKDPPADKAAFAAKLRAAGLGPVAVTVRPGGETTDRLADALFRHLDRDGDGKLSAAELAAARDRLAALDLNEDELISGPELLGTAVSAAARRFRPVLPADAADDAPAGTATLLPLPNGSAAAVKALLTSRDQDKNGALSRTEFGADAKAFAALDKDGNGQLDTDELAAWLRQPPEAEFAVVFDGSPAAGLTPDATGEVARPLADARLRVSADGTAAKSLADAWGQTADRLRAEFARLGKGKPAVERKQIDGSRETRGLLPFFDLADRNGDKTLTKDELDAALAAAGSAAAVRVEITVVDLGRGLFELLDRNGDGQLSPRELGAAPSLLRAFGREAAGGFGKADIPRLLPVTLSPAGITLLTGPQQQFVIEPAVMAVAPGVMPHAPAGVPAWFAKMDRNGDGDVSRREFLGPLELFRKLDRDGDGLISPDEARAAGK